MVNYHDIIVVLNGLTENYGDGEPKDTHGYSHLSIQIKKMHCLFQILYFFARQISWDSDR